MNKGYDLFVSEGAISLVTNPKNYKNGLKQKFQAVFMVEISGIEPLTS